MLCCDICSPIDSHYDLIRFTLKFRMKQNPGQSSNVLGFKHSAIINPGNGFAQITKIPGTELIKFVLVCQWLEFYTLFIGF